jgi:hypothetical protein
MSAFPSFDRSAIEAHVSLLHDLAEGLDGILILAAFEAGGHAQVQQFRIGDVDGMVGTIMGFENHPNLNFYAPWSVFRRDLESSKKGSEADVLVALAAVGDLDNDKYSLGELPVEARLTLSRRHRAISNRSIFSSGRLPPPMPSRSWPPFAILSAAIAPQRTLLTFGEFRAA